MSPMAEKIEIFLKAKRQLTPSTQESYKRILGMFAAATGEVWPVLPGHIDDYFEHLRTKSNPCANGGIHAHFRVIRTWLNWLEKRQHLEQNPIELLTQPTRPKPLPHAPKADHLFAFFRAINTVSTHPAYLAPRNLALFHFLLETGLRISELCNLTLDDLDLTHRTAQIHQTKNKIAREVIFDNALVVKHLTYWLEVRQGLNIPPEEKHLFVGWNSPYGAWFRLSPQAVRNARDKYIQAAKIPHFRLHDLRHAFGVYSLRAKMDLIDIKNQLGHTNLATTMRYTLVADDGRAERHARYSPTGWLCGGR